MSITFNRILNLDCNVPLEIKNGENGWIDLIINESIVIPISKLETREIQRTLLSLNAMLISDERANQNG